MPTYTPISSQTLSSSAASITFSSIPSTYTDLVIRTSTRSSLSGATNFFVTFNGSSTAVYSATYVVANITSVSSGRESNNAYSSALYTTSTNNATANVFGSAEIYIPSYTATQNKAFSAIGHRVNNSTTTAIGIAADAMLWSNTSAITSITLTPETANFSIGSSFYLYGISNS